MKSKSGEAMPEAAGDDIAFDDHKIAFTVKYCRDQDVLDIGCVGDRPDDYRSRYWVHRAVASVAKSVVGLDSNQAGVEAMRGRGFDAVLGNAEQFDLGRKFDVIVAGDLIERLENFNGFLECCKAHMRPGARLLISTANPWYWRKIIKAALHKEVGSDPRHTCWICARKLRQLLKRHGMELGEIRFGSRYLRDRLMPLPAGWKHGDYHAEVFLQA
jgi:2-polyprenyl-3-methyl-5-hydroxy-6-metoxy-1,4-benzoquinol methylase